MERGGGERGGLSLLSTGARLISNLVRRVMVARLTRFVHQRPRLRGLEKGGKGEKERGEEEEEARPFRVDEG